MSDPFEVLVPLLNPNEPEARVAGLMVIPGQRVEVGDILCTLETTKAAVNVVAEREGYVISLRAVVGDMLQAGERLCWLAEDAGWQPPETTPVEEPDTRRDDNERQEDTDTFSAVSVSGVPGGP